MVFHVRWIFLTTSRLRRGWDSETSGEKSISHGKPYTMLFLAYFALQGMLVMLNTLRKVEDHENHVRWIYLTTVLKVRSMRELCIKIFESENNLSLPHMLIAMNVFFTNCDI